MVMQPKMALVVAAAATDHQAQESKRPDNPAFF
jgi:hypothetical protein